MLSNYWKLLVFLCVAASCTSAKNNDSVEYEPALVGLNVKDLDETTDWYVRNLGFTIDTTMIFPSYGLKINMLVLGSFKLELTCFDDAVEIDRNLLPNDYSNVHGFIKLGFVTNDLAGIVSQMNRANVETIAGPADLPPLKSGEPWPDRFYLVKDPDGNYVQFFEGESMLSGVEVQGDRSVAPFLAMISVGNFSETINWYKKLGFEYLEGIEEPGNQRGLLSSGKFIIEIGSFEGDANISELNFPAETAAKVVRMSKLGFRIDNIDEMYEKLKVDRYSFFYEEMEGEDLNFIIEDTEKNYLQFFK